MHYAVDVRVVLNAGGLTTIRKVIWLAALGSALAWAQSVTTEGAERRRTVPAFSPTGPVELPAVLFRVHVRHAGNGVESGDMVVVYDPVNGYYFWRLNPLRDPSDSQDLAQDFDVGADALYASKAALVDFLMPGGGVFVLKRVQKAASLGDAEKAAMDEVRRNLPIFEERGYDPGYKEADVRAAIGGAWACAEDDVRANCGFGAKRLVSIREAGENWTIVAQNRWNQEIVLDARFNFVSTRPLGLGGEYFWMTPLAECPAPVPLQRLFGGCR